MTLYDSKGKAIAYSEDGESIYLFTGEPVAYLVETAVYGFNGHHIGWFENGWMRDLHGCCVFFTEDASGSGPAKPAMHAKPAKYAKKANPAKYARHAKRCKTANKLSWSDLSGVIFFAQ